jgi:hypothetical protein
MTKATARANWHEGRADLRLLGKRLERLMCERESAENLRVEAGAAFEKIAPKITSEALPNTSVTKAWDGLLDPPKTARPLSLSRSVVALSKAQEARA